LPNKIFPLYAAAGAIFAIAVIKHSFGGLGSNWLNPAAGGWLFINFSWPASFRTALEASPLSLLTESFNHSGTAVLDLATLYAASTPFTDTFRSVLNSTIFSFSAAELPAGYLELFVSRSPGIIADRGVLALLLGTIIICATQVSRFWIPAVFLAVFGLLVRIAGALPFGGNLGYGDVLFALCSGGTLVAAFFLAADPATGAKSNRGILLAITLGGVITFLFRYFGAEPYGAVFALLFLNAMLPLIRIAETNRLYKKQGTQI
jgi:electron transport complex protein RnfD